MEIFFLFMKNDYLWEPEACINLCIKKTFLSFDEDPIQNLMIKP